MVGTKVVPAEDIKLRKDGAMEWWREWVIYPDSQQTLDREGGTLK
jgi:hypothetical protein